MDQLGVRINVLPPGGGDCVANFTNAGPIQLTGGAFTTSIGNATFTNSSGTTPIAGGIDGTFSSTTNVSGILAAFSGSYSFRCFAQIFFGTGGVLWTNKMWSARPIVPNSVDIRFASISVGYAHVCGLTAAGVAYCWGNNQRGGLGDGTTTTRSVPTLVAGGLTFASISVGGYNTCGLTTAGVAYCWGWNFSGELGTGNKIDSPVPVAVTGGRTFAFLTAASGRGCGIDLAGALFCWGSNYNNGLGNGAPLGQDSPTPVAVGPGIAFKSVSSAGDHSCGITTAGAAYCWGRGFEGEIGDGSKITRLTPVPVSGGLTFASVTAANTNTCGVTTTGVGYCWGDDSREQLGNLAGGSTTVPVPIAGGHTFAVVTAGDNHTCGVTTAGTAYCWGWNLAGALGIGLGETEGDAFGQHSGPVAVFGGLSLTTITAGNGRTCGIATGGTGYCWGYAQSLGNGNAGVQAAVPFPIAAKY
jgi:alpha-tubulin suppressor-like RCC1 family protein